MFNSIISLILGIAIGFALGSIRRLNIAKDCLENLNVNDPQFDGKTKIIKKFNTFV